MVLGVYGATCGEDLRRIPDQEGLAETLQDAARRRGLVDDADELRRLADAGDRDAGRALLDALMDARWDPHTTMYSQY